MKDKTAVIILAAGNGARMGSHGNKVFLPIKGKPILAHTLDRFYNLDYIDQIIVALNPNDIELFEEEIQKPYGFENVKVIQGGEDRQESAYRALKALDDSMDYVLIHDGARPFTSEAVIRDCLEKTKKTEQLLRSYQVLIRLKCPKTENLLIILLKGKIYMKLRHHKDFPIHS